jgi:hypothetical protein
MALSDLDETNFSIEQKVLASSMESYYRQEHGRKQRASVPATASPSRRRRGSPSPQELDETRPFTPVAAIPQISATSAIFPMAASSTAPVNSRFTSPGSSDTATTNAVTDEEYPQVIQELVMNGFELQDVVRAYEFVGDRFDDILSFLLSSKTC